MKHDQIRIGLDLDDTITAAPSLFRLLSAALLASGHEAHIVTYRPDSTEKEIAADLREHGLVWTAIHHPSDFTFAASDWKRDIALAIGLDLLIDVNRDVVAAVADVTVAFRLVASPTS